MASHLILTAFALLALIGCGNGNPISCDNINSDFDNCLPPITAYLQSPEAKAFGNLFPADQEDDLKEPLVKAGCQAIRTTADCVVGRFDRCANDIPDIQTLVNGTRKLLAVCDRTDLLASTKTALKCFKTSAFRSIFDNSTEVAFRGCMTEAQRGLDITFKARGDARQILTDGTVLREVCCYLKKVSACTAPVLWTCSPEAVALGTAIDQATFAAYGCESRVGAGCTVPTPAVAA